MADIALNLPVQASLQLHKGLNQSRATQEKPLRKERKRAKKEKKKLKYDKKKPRRSGEAASRFL